MFYLALTKPDVSFLVVMTTLAGFYLGSRGALDWLLAWRILFSALRLIAAGTSALNHFFERYTDAHMRRTAMRPLPSGQLPHPRSASLWPGTLVVIGRCLSRYNGGNRSVLARIVHHWKYLDFTRR